MSYDKPLVCEYTRNRVQSTMDTLLECFKGNQCSHVVSIPLGDKKVAHVDILVIAEPPCYNQNNEVGRDCGKRGPLRLRIVGRQKAVSKGSRRIRRSESMVFFQGELHSSDDRLIQFFDDSGAEGAAEIKFSIPPYNERFADGPLSVGEQFVDFTWNAASEMSFGRATLKWSVSVDEDGDRAGVSFGAKRPQPVVDGKTVVNVTIPSSVHLDHEQRVIEKMFGSTTIDAIVSETDEVVLSRYSVVGDYSRFDEVARNRLKDRAKRIVDSLENVQHSRGYFLIWAPPGSGKSYFVTELAASLNPSIDFDMVNLLNTNDQSFAAWLAKPRGRERPTLLFIDEIDGLYGQAWPYERLCAALDTSNGNNSIVYVFAGSLKTGFNEMKRHIQTRPKGPDLLDRVPEHNQFEIPAASAGDLLCVFCKQLALKAATMNRKIISIDKLALCWILLNQGLRSPRRLSDLAGQVLSRLNESHIRLEHFFDTGEPEIREFLMRNESLIERFGDRSCRISE